VSNGATLAPVHQQSTRISLCSMNSSHSVNSRRMTRIVYSAAGAVTGVALTPVLVHIALGWLGFSATGVVASKFPSQVHELAR